MPKKNTEPAYKTIETITHPDANRVNIPTAEYQSIMRKDEQSPIRLAYERRNRDLDPQLVWRGKDEQDWSDLVVHAPPLYIQEKVHPKVLIDDLVREREGRRPPKQTQFSLFADFNGIADEAAKTEFYQHAEGLFEASDQWLVAGGLNKTQGTSHKSLDSCVQWLVV
ncbi:hypothetical protein [Desulfonatronum parangueonense]